MKKREREREREKRRCGGKKTVWAGGRIVVWKGERGGRETQHNQTRRKL